MKKNEAFKPGMLAAVLALVTCVSAGSPAGTPVDHDTLLTEGKAAADLGELDRAARAFTSVADGVGAGDPRRWDALVRLGVVRSAMGDARGSLEAYERVRSEYASNPQAIRLLALAVSGVVPDGPRFESTWRDVRLASGGAPAGQQPRVLWPGASDVQVPDLPGGSERVTLAVEEMDLPVFFLQLFGAVLERRNAAEMRGGAPLPPPPPGAGEKEAAKKGPRFRMPQPFPDAYRAPGGIEQLNLFVHPGVEGKVTVRVTETPWRDVFAEVLKSHHLRCITRGSVVWISRHADPPPPPDVLAARTQSKSVLRGLELRDAPIGHFLERVAKMTGLEIEMPPELEGRITLRLSDLAGEEAFALVLFANGLSYTRSEDSVRVLPLDRR